MHPEELLQRMSAGTAPVVVDVRTGFEFRRGHIPGALHAPTWKIVLGLAALPPRKDGELVVTCELGPRAALARLLLALMGYRNASLLTGHMALWRRHGLPLDR